MDGNDRVAAFITRLAWEALPPAVQRKARMALLDVLGAALAGTQARISRITAGLAAELWPGAEATVLGHGRSASAVGAAFANANAANALDIDDCGMYTKGHPGAQVVPAALAVAEALGKSGAALLAAIVAGYEVAHRAGRIWHDLHAEYQACGSWGSVACAAVAAKLMDLTPGQTCHALGIAEYHAPNLPMRRDLDHPAMVKHGIGWGAMTGIVAARLAARGFTGIPSLFGLPSYEPVVASIGQHYIMVEGVIWKRHACCAWSHAALRGAELLARAHAIQPEDIARVRVEAYDDAVRLGTDLPTTTEEAQFSLAWPLAAMLVDGEVGPDQVLEHRLDDPGIQALAHKVELVETGEMNDLYRRALEGRPGGRFGSAVTITLHNGQKLTSGIVEGEIKYPEQHWDERSLEEKFRALAGRVLDAPRVDALAGLVWHCEEIADVRELADLLA